MKYFVFLLLFACANVQAQKLKKADKLLLANLQAHVAFLASDSLEGRRTGSAGERLAYEYIIQQFTNAGLQPKGSDGFLQPFEVNDGKYIHPSSHLVINGNDLQIEKEFFPLSFSANQSVEATAAISLQEAKSCWFADIKDFVESNHQNPHYDLEDGLKMMAEKSQRKGAGALILYNSSAIADGLAFSPKAKTTALNIPVVYVTKEAAKKYLHDETATLDIKCKILVAEKKRTGHNVAGFIDNNAATTIIIGAHYDHLGYGEDHNSLYTGASPAIHNGADDNASGTAALLELAKLLKQSKLTTNNYLLLAFSGEELGLFGSKYFTSSPTIDLSSVNYMINLDMVGRLNDSSHALSIGGFGTSPVWGELIPPTDRYFTIKIDSSGTGPSDHTSFYRKDIPVLFLFTGLHTDYHKPSDDADKINYTGELMVIKWIMNLIAATEKKPKLAFNKTREMSMSAKSSFKVTLGIMPDYSYSGTGVRVDGVVDGKIAQKVGIIAGDVLVQLGEHKFTDVQSYMEALSKFNKGDATKVKLIRGKEQLEYDIVF